MIGLVLFIYPDLPFTGTVIEASKTGTLLALKEGTWIRAAKQEPENQIHTTACNTGFPSNRTAGILPRPGSRSLGISHLAKSSVKQLYISDGTGGSCTLEWELGSTPCDSVFPSTIFSHTPIEFSISQQVYGQSGSAALPTSVIEGQMARQTNTQTARQTRRQTRRY